jgi:hypothetical protein
LARRDDFVDIDGNEEILLKCILKTYDVSCINVAKNRYQWWSLKNAVMNIVVLLKGREFLGCLIDT